MNALWKISDFCNAVQGESIGSFSSDVFGISIDTRTLKKGDAFFPIKGKNYDGHDFINDAIFKGSSVILMEKKGFYAYKNQLFIIVENVLRALEKLAIASRKRFSGKIIAISGSVGKTTTKEMIRHTFSKCGKVYANIKSYNNYLGVLFTLVNMNPRTDFGIFEIGMNHKNELRYISKLLNPNIIIVTKIGEAHLENFSNVFEIADAKAESFDGLMKGGTILLNSDDNFFYYLKDKAYQCGIKNIFSFGINNNADYSLIDFSLNMHSTSFKIKISDQEFYCKVKVPGFHILQNILSVFALADILSLKTINIVSSLKSFQGLPGRGARYKISLPSGGKFTLIDESYNANPISMKSAIALLKKNDVSKNHQGRSIAVLGDMLELGKNSQKKHEEISKYIINYKIDLLFLCGKNMRYLFQYLLSNNLEMYYENEPREIFPIICEKIKKDDIVMIKASKKIKIDCIISSILNRYQYL